MDIINNFYVNGIIVLFLFSTSFFLGLLAFNRNKKSQINTSFTRFAIATAFWILLAFLTDLPFLRNISLILAKFLYLALITLSFSIFNLTFVFPKKRNLFPPIKYIFLIWAIILIILTFTTNLIIKNLTHSEWITNIIDGDLAPLFYIFMLIGAFSPIQYIFFYKKLSGKEKLQVKLFVIGLSIFMLMNIIVQSVVKPFITHNDDYYKIGTYSSFFMILLTGYAIIKNRFMDISYLVARTVSYTILVSLFGVFYVVSFTTLSSFFLSNALETKTIAISVILSLIMVFSFLPLRRMLEKLTDKLFYKNRYDANSLLYNLTYIMASTLRLENVTHNILKELLQQMRLTQGAFILTEGDKIYEVAHEGYDDKIPEFDEEKIHTLLNFNHTLVFEEIPEGEEKDIMRSLDLSLIAQLNTEGEKIGLLVLGPKLSGDVYTEEDIKVIEISAPGAAVAIQNAKSYEEIRRFNITLEEEVQKATKDLEIANNKLVQLDKLKDDFVSVASHELRTPMTAIKSYLWMALNRVKEPLTPELKKYLDIAYFSTDRLIKLVQDMLTISRIEGNRLSMNIEKINLFDCAKQIFDELKIEADKKKIVLTIKSEVEAPFIEGDKDKLREVIQNLLGNALKFTSEGGKIGIAISQKDGFIETSVEDTGPGIKEEEQGKLFGKFERIDSVYARNPQISGTGLGLYITKQIVTLHKGKIWVNSKVGEGSTFTFSLPKYIGTNPIIV